MPMMLVAYVDRVSEREQKGKRTTFLDSKASMWYFLTGMKRYFFEAPE